LALTYQPVEALVYDFTPYNDLASWNNYATSIGGTTYLNAYYGTPTEGVFFSSDIVGYFQLPLPQNYNSVEVTFNNPHPNFVNLRIDTLANIANSTPKLTLLYGESDKRIWYYNTGDYLRIDETNSGVIGKNIIIKFFTIQTKTYTLNFPVNTTCDILAINNSQYIKTTGVTLNGSYNVVVGSTSKIQQNGTDLYVPNTNLSKTDSITGSSVTYIVNNPIVIIRYFMGEIISNVVTTQNVVPVGYLKFDGSDWNVENSGILTSKVLQNELCLSRYLSSNMYSMINIYEYSVVKVVNNVSISSNWYEINNEKIIYIAKEGYTGTYPTYQNNFVGNILKIRLKSCSLENIYKRFLIDHNSYTHKINCTIKNVAGTSLYNSSDLDITKATFFSKPELFGSGINLSISNIPVNVKHILELKLYVSYDASTNSIATTKQQTDKFYLFYEQF